MPSLHVRPLAPSVIGTEMLLDKEILGAILISLRADQNWIDTLSMLRRVHSFWNHVARLICPELIPDNPRMFYQGEKETWLSDFHREQELVQHRTRERREGPQLAFANIARNVFDDIRTYPANLTSSSMPCYYSMEAFP